MATKQYHLQLLRGDSPKVQAYLGREGELVFDKSQKNLWLHDGVKRGGIPIAMISNIPTKVSQLENDKGYATTAPGSPSADSAVKDQLGNTIHLYYAPVNNPNFTGKPTCPTPAANDRSKQIANTEWVAQATCVVHTTGNETINGTKTFVNTINGTALRANWADLAELYKSDKAYEPGTLVQFGGSEEITVATSTVNAVVSEKPAYLMNSGLENGLPIALAGRVKVRVNGVVKKFDRLVLDPQRPGVAKVDNNSTQPIAVALETGEHLVLCSTQFSLT